MFIRWSRHTPNGKIIIFLSGVVDLMPALLEMAGTKPVYLKELDGYSLKAAIMDASPDHRNRTLFSYWNNKLSIRQGEYFLNAENELYNTTLDRLQSYEISVGNEMIKGQMFLLKERFESTVLAQFSPVDELPFTIGHPGEYVSKLPARDAKGHGGIERSNRYPNSSYFKNWKDTSDYIIWDVEVEKEGFFEVIVFYTCAESDIGAKIELNIGKSQLESVLTESNDVPMLGAELDRVPRQESYVKVFAPFILGDIYLQEGTQTVTLKATCIPGEEVMYFQMLAQRRKEIAP